MKSKFQIMIGFLEVCGLFKGVLLASLFVFELLKTNCDALTVLDV